MQTSFTEAQRADPHLREVERQLRACVHCGFCNATCPTYQLRGDELDGPRGRIYLVKAMLEQADTPPSAIAVRHLDRCLTCLSCTTTCPSGVNYLHVVDHARAHIETRHRRSLPDRWLRRLLMTVLPRPWLFQAALRLGRLVAPLARHAPGRMGALLALAPAGRAATAAGPAAVTGNGPRRIGLVPGCVQQVLGSSTNAAAARLLARAGCTVHVLAEAACCGAVEQHLGAGAAARARVEANVRAWAAEAVRLDLEAIVVTASGCGSMVKEYGHLLRDHPVLAVPAARIAALARDLTELIADLPRPGRAPAMRVAWHSPCSLQHGLRLGDLPRQRLVAAGYDVQVPQDAHLCCGAAGTYQVLQPELSARLGQDRSASLDALAPAVVATANLGCALQLGRHSRVPVVHVAELLDWAHGGPVPAALADHA